MTNAPTTETQKQRSLPDAISDVGAAIRDIKACKKVFADECNERIKALTKVEESLYLQRRDNAGIAPFDGIQVPSFSPDIERLIEHPTHGI